MQTLPVARNTPEAWNDYYSPASLRREWLCSPEILSTCLETCVPRKRLEICDFGSGTSSLAAHLAQEGWGSVTCLDWAGSAVRWQNTNFSRQGKLEGSAADRLGENEARLTDCRAVEFESGAFDVVFCKAVLEFAVLLGSATEAVQIVHEVCRVLKPSGVAIVCAQMSPKALKALLEDASLPWESVTVSNHAVEKPCLSVVSEDTSFLIATCRKRGKN